MFAMNDSMKYPAPRSLCRIPRLHSRGIKESGFSRNDVAEVTIFLNTDRTTRHLTYPATGASDGSRLHLSDKCFERFSSEIMHSGQM
jgi:hypothetical protein